MNCKEVKDILSPYLDGALDLQEMSSAEKHLEKCPCCRRELDRLKKTLTIIQSLPDLPLPEDFQWELHKKLAAARGESEKIKRKGWLHIFPYQWASLGAAAVLLLVMYTFLPPFFMPSEQSDMPAPGAIQNQEQKYAGDADKVEQAEAPSSEEMAASLPDKEEETRDDTHNENSQKKAETNTGSGKEDGQSLKGKEGQRTDASQAARGEKNNGAAETSPQEINPEAAQTPVFTTKAFVPAPEEELSGDTTASQDTVITLIVEDDEYEAVFERISHLSSEMPDVLEVVFEETADEEKEGSFTVTVAQGTVSQVAAALKEMGTSVSQDVYGSGMLDETGTISVKVTIKEETAP